MDKGFYDLLEDELYESFRGILNKLGFCETQVLYANQNILEPTNTYCVIDILDYDQTGRMSEASFVTKDDDYLESVSHYVLKLQLSFIGKEARYVAPSVQHAIKNNRACFEELNKRAFGVISTSRARNSPQKRETEWVDGFNMDLNLSFAILTRQSFDWVEYISVGGQEIRMWNAPR